MRYIELSSSPLSIIAMIRLVISGDNRLTPEIMTNEMVAITRYFAHGPANQNSLISFLINTASSLTGYLKKKKKNEP
jgi:hypothetical protein